MTLLFPQSSSVDPEVPPEIHPPTSKNLLDWSAGLAQIAAQIAAVQKKYPAIAAELSDARALVTLFAQGAKNWSTVVRP